jgi:hypothetical protein
MIKSDHTISTTFGAKLTATVTLGNLSQTYDGAQKTATATTNPSGLAVTFTYNGSATAPTNASSYTVVGTINDANYQGSATGTLTIAKAPATVTLGSLSQTYDGTPKLATATTSPDGLLVDFTYNGSAAAPTNVGSYPVVGTINNPNYQGSSTGTNNLVIAPRPITVTADAKTKVYGTADPALTYTITSGSLAGTDTLTGALTRVAGEAVGPYAIQQGTLANSNYQITYIGANLTITNANATVTLGNLSQTYDGTQKTATATTNPSGLAVTFTYNGSATAPTNASSYTVVGTINDANYQGSATGTLTIAKATASVTPNATSKTYGTADPTLSGTLSGFLPADNVTATYSRTAGEIVTGSPYTISATLSPAGVLGNYTITYNTANFTINKATASVTPNAASKTYGTADPTLSGTLSGFLPADNVTATYSRTAGDTVAGSPYTISATLSPAGVLGNYTITYNTANFTINKATPTITWANPADITYGTTLGTTQLNATASVAGSFVYNPPAGTLLNAGDNQILSVTFTPDDAANYTNNTANVQINVK